MEKPLASTEEVVGARLASPLMEKPLASTEEVVGARLASP